MAKLNMPGGLGSARPLVSSRDEIRVDSWVCSPFNPFSGLTINTAACIPTEEDLRQWQVDQLKTTQQTATNQQQAVEWADEIITADRVQNPDDYCASDALVESPWMASIFGGETVCKYGGPGGGVLQAALMGLAVVAGFAIFGALKK